MNNTIKFYTLCFFLWALTAISSYYAYHIAKQDIKFAFLFTVQLVHFMSSYVFIGLGLASIVIFLTFILGWVQLALLLGGDIHPHLSEKGLLNVLSTLFNHI